MNESKAYTKRLKMTQNGVKNIENHKVNEKLLCLELSDINKMFDKALIFIKKNKPHNGKIATAAHLSNTTFNQNLNNTGTGSWQTHHKVLVLDYFIKYRQELEEIEK